VGYAGGGNEITVRCALEEQASRLEFVAHFKIIEHQGVTINAAHSVRLKPRAREAAPSNKINSLRKRDTERARSPTEKET
jgi:hypothetical protein